MESIVALFIEAIILYFPIKFHLQLCQETGFPRRKAEIKEFSGLTDTVKVV